MFRNQYYCNKKVTKLNYYLSTTVSTNLLVKKTPQKKEKLS